MKMRYAFNFRQIFSICYLVAATFIVCLFLVNIGSGVKTSRNISAAASQTEAYRYLVKNHNGHIGIFSGESAEPEKVLSIRVDSLPAADIEALNKGIRLHSDEELLRLIEDYSS